MASRADFSYPGIGAYVNWISTKFHWEVRKSWSVIFIKWVPETCGLFVPSRVRPCFHLICPSVNGRIPRTSYDGRPPGESVRAPTFLAASFGRYFGRLRYTCSCCYAGSAIRLKLMGLMSRTGANRNPSVLPVLGG